MTRAEEFRMVAGVVLAQLDEAFPEEIEIDEKKAAESCSVEVIKQSVDPLAREAYDAYAGSEYSYGTLPSGRHFLSVLWSTLKWLRDEGMIRAEGQYATHAIVLTSKSKDALAKASGSGGQIGESMTDAARNLTVDENKSKLTTSVGEFLGSFVKGAFLS